jgi:hypothetical protein
MTQAIDRLGPLDEIGGLPRHDIEQAQLALRRPETDVRQCVEIMPTMRPSRASSGVLWQERIPVRDTSPGHRCPP